MKDARADRDSHDAPTQSISGLLRNIEALYAIVPSHARSQLMATLRMTPYIESPFIDLFGRVPESAKIEDVIDWINGVNAFYLAISSLKPEATIREAKKAAASIITSQPYLGDVDGSVNSVPLSALLVATAHPVLAENQKDPVVQAIAVEQLEMYIASSELPFTGSFLNQMWDKLGIKKKVKEVETTINDMKEGALGNPPAARSSDQPVKPVTPIPLTQLPIVPSPVPSVLPGTPGRPRLYRRDDVPTVSIPKLINTPVPITPAAVAAEMVNSQEALKPNDLAKMSIVATSAGTPIVQKDLAGVARAMDDMVRQSVGQMQALSSDIEANKTALDSITNLQVKLKWMNSIAKMPDDVALMLHGVAPDFSSAPNAIATVTGVVASLPDSTTSGKVSSVWQKLISPFRGDALDEPIPYYESSNLTEAEEEELARQELASMGMLDQVNSL